MANISAVGLSLTSDTKSVPSIHSGLTDKESYASDDTQKIIAEN
jgi:hypothetical protein